MESNTDFLFKFSVNFMLSKQTDVIGSSESPTCYLCGKHGETLYHGLQDHLFGAPGSWGFKRCSNSSCGFIWLDPMPTRDEIWKAYRSYYTHKRTKFELSELLGYVVRAIFRIPLSIFLQILNDRKRRRYMYLDRLTPGRLLDVGCGSGYRLERMRALGWEVFGQEIDPVAAEYARNKFGVDIHLGPLEEMAAPAGGFDAVIMSHVIEHVYDPVATLSDCHRLLRKGGKLVVSTPNAESYGHQKFGLRWRGLEPPRHLHLFTGRTLTQVFQRAGFCQFQYWTSDVTADHIGRSSNVLPYQATPVNQRVFSMGDEFRGLLFQVAAHRYFLKDKDCGEECIMVATK